MEKIRLALNGVTILMKNTYATFVNPADAEKAAGALLDHGIKADHISIVFPEGYRSAEHNGDNGSHAEQNAKNGITTTTAGDATAGAAKGAGIGLAAGALAALAAVMIPGFGLVLGGGALAIALGGVAGTTVAGAVAGGAAGFLMDQGVPDQAVEHYTRTLTTGGALLTISQTDEKIDPSEIDSLLNKYNGSVASYPIPATSGRL